MTREQAHSILNIDENATEKEIKAAHRRIIQKIHPDQGGSDYLAAQVNRAKEILLKTD
jgi:DnaJ-class molecular chaperone